jgi:hypothetical protein
MSILQQLKEKKGTVSSALGKKLKGVGNLPPPPCQLDVYHGTNCPPLEAVAN